MVSPNFSYSLLPTHSGGLEKSSTIPRYLRVLSSRRIARFVALVLLTFASFTFIISHTPNLRTQHSSPWSNQSLAYPTYPIPRDLPPLSTTEDAVTTLPPLYHEYTAYEDALPQHDHSLPSPEGSDAKFVFFANHAWGAGWGNIMQSMILEAHLAYASGRT